MIRPNIRSAHRVFSQRRGLASHTLEQWSVSQLRTEARRRGLPSSGNKATLISRIQHVESPSKRDASTTPAKITIQVSLPDLSVEPDLPGPQIPFLPDFWNSAHVREADAISHVEPEFPLRKVIVVGGSTVQLAEGVAYDSEASHHESESSSPSPSTPVRKEGLFADMMEDLGLPPTFDSKLPFTKAKEIASSLITGSQSDQQHFRFQSKRLDPEEKRGVWALLFILGGSWLAGGIFAPKKDEPASHEA